MPEPVVVLQSDLKTRSATVEEQAVLDSRNQEIVEGKRKDEELFDPEPEEKKAPVKKESKEEKPEKEGDIPDADLLETKDEDLTDEQKSRKSDLTRAKEAADREVEDEKILETKDEDLDEKGKARKAELAKAKEGTKTDEDKQKEFDEEVKSYAKENEVSEEDARKDLESISKITDNFKGNAKKLAKTHLHMQRRQAKTDEELKALKDEKSKPPLKEITAPMIEDAISKGFIKLDGKAATKEDIISEYRKDNPDETETADDDTVFKLFAKGFKDRAANKHRDNLSQMSKAAKDKREKLIADMSDDVKKFLPDIKPVLDKFSDAFIMSDDFSLTDIVLHAKGKTYDTSIKDAEERGFKRGIEARRIIGEIKKPAEGKTKTKSSSGSGKTSLTEKEQGEARTAFSGNNISDERKFELYEEMLEHDKALKEKNKPKA